jgi:hypothetical protein
MAERPRPKKRRKSMTCIETMRIVYGECMCIEMAVSVSVFVWQYQYRHWCGIFGVAVSVSVLHSNILVRQYLRHGIHVLPVELKVQI